MGRAPASEARCLVANRRRNALATPSRRAAWAPTRDAAWALLDPYARDGARVAVVGAGNGDDLPLARLAARAGALDLVDLDGAAAARALARLPQALRGRAAVRECDVTAGEAERIVTRTLAGIAGGTLPAALPALAEEPYDVVVGDLLYSQLLYPALLDAGLSGPAIAAALRRHASALTAAVVDALQRSSRGVVVHVHDPLGWWSGHEQPHAPAVILAEADADVEAALALVAEGRGPTGADPRAALAAAGAEIVETRLWPWPFRPGVEYLACATVARGAHAPP